MLRTYHLARCPMASCSWRSVPWNSVIRALNDLLCHMADKHRAIVEVTGLEDE